MWYRVGVCIFSCLAALSAVWLRGREGVVVVMGNYQGIMFTGIIEELGTVAALRREGNVARLAVRAAVVRDDLRLGDSLAVNGVCLTVERIETAQLWLSMMPETLRHTTLGTLTPGAQVNLERALRLDSRLGGHLVSGHVDGIGTVQAVRGVGEERILTIALPPALERYIAPKGSVAVDGISLTVVEVDAGAFAVSLIRHTMSATTLALRTTGDTVNLEVDLIARYLDRLLASSGHREGLTLERMRELGF